ncbi:IS110 family transposase [Jeotgalibacillus proteolyticus]|uniref:IS110 family transposase n=1 Tax=Jeotgalibacillus proteolyticus TaxID=2082395 RepID=UPI003CEBBC86
MHLNRNEKINQITEKTLVIGIDIAKSSHFACATDDRGRELQKSWQVKQSRQGFETLHAEIVTLMGRHEKTNVFVGFEPTGHYWMNLASFLEARSIPFLLVNPLHVKRTKELEDNLQSKNDMKDARLIAKMIPQGHYSIPRIMRPVDQELRRGSAFRDRLRKDKGSVLNRIRRWFDLYFPEFSAVFKEVGVQAKAILRLVPLPGDVLNLGSEAILQTIRAQQVKALGPDKIDKLYQAASISIYCSDSPEMARKEIYFLLDQLDMFETQIDEVTRNLIELAKELPDFQYLRTVQGISETTVAELLAETGSLKLYDNPRQLIKLAGLTLTAQESGDMKGRKKLSKRGRKKLRHLLYKTVFPLIHHNDGFKQLFNYYKDRKDNPLKGKEAIVVLCSKILKIFHGLSHKETVFDSDRMIQDLPFLSQQLAA